MTVPFRVEEWGKERRARTPDWWPEAQKVLASGKPYFLREDQKKPWPTLRGRPGLGMLATFIGLNASAPRKPWMPSAYRVVLEDFARTEKEAQARADAFAKARIAERIGKARQRARIRQVSGGRAAGSGSASPAKSESSARKPGT